MLKGAYMDPIVQLWLPILVSAVVVFFASFLLHMLVKHHNGDFKQIPNETRIMDELRKLKIPAGDYVFPFAKDDKERNTKEYKDKYNKGPVAIITIYPSGPMSMGASLAMWFVYSIVVGIFAAYIAGHALPPGAHYLSVFRFAGCTAFVGYTLALLHDSIWFKRNWATTFKYIFDGLVYALLTGGVFGWLWPAV
jgi:hypothetical protein